MSPSLLPSFLCVCFQRLMTRLKLGKCPPGKRNSINVAEFMALLQGHFFYNYVKHQVFMQDYAFKFSQQV